jgi:hypothetical protein
VQVDVDFMEAVNGVKKKVTVEKKGSRIVYCRIVFDVSGK